MTENLQKKRLAQAIFELQLSFLREISHLITRFSKNSQKFDVLRFHGMLYYDKVIHKLLAARDSLNKGERPVAESIDAVGRHKKIHMWDEFSSCVKSIIEIQTFFEFKLLLPSESGCVTR